MRVTWRLVAPDPDLASVRYRCLIPIGALPGDHRLSWGADDPGDGDAVVFVKTFGERETQQARAARARGVRVLVDVCDNVFADGSNRAAGLRAIAAHADVLTTTGPALADVLRSEMPGVAVAEIPDPLETEADAAAGAARLWRARAAMGRRHPLVAARSALVAARSRRAAAPGPPSGDRPVVLWFGNAGSFEPRFGLVNLADAAGELAAAHAQVPFELRVVTGTRAAFDERLAGLDVPRTFVPWDRRAVHRELRGAAVAFLPNSRDAFSICKSANRAVTALHAGVPVVATPIPSLAPLEGCLGSDLAAYLSVPERGAQDVERARAVIAREYAPDAVAARWAEVLGRA